MNEDPQRLVDAWLSGTATYKNQHQLLSALRSDGASALQDLATEAMTEASLRTIARTDGLRREAIHKILNDPIDSKTRLSRRVAVFAFMGVAAAAALILFLRSPATEFGEPVGSYNATVSKDHLPAPIERIPDSTSDSLRPAADSEYFEELAKYYLPNYEVSGLTIDQALTKLTSGMIASERCPKPDILFDPDLELSQLSKVTLSLRCYSIRTLAAVIALRAGAKLEESGKGFYLRASGVSEERLKQSQSEISIDLLATIQMRQSPDFELGPRPLRLLQDEISTALGASVALEPRGKNTLITATPQDLDILHLLRKDLFSPARNWVFTCTTNQESTPREPLLNDPTAADSQDIRNTSKSRDLPLGIWAILPLAPASKRVADLDVKSDMLHRLQSLEKLENIANNPEVISLRTMLEEYDRIVTEDKVRVCLVPVGDGKKVRVLLKETVFSAVENLGEVESGKQIFLDFPSSPGVEMLLVPSKSPPGPELPFGIPVEGKAGFVTSPFAPEKGMVDVRDIPFGTKVECPYTGKHFRVP